MVIFIKMRNSSHGFRANAVFNSNYLDLTLKLPQSTQSVEMNKTFCRFVFWYDDS